VTLSLKAAGVAPVYHIHRMNPEYIAHVRAKHEGYEVELDSVGLKLYRHVMQKQRPARLITLVREPVGRNISDFFRHMDLFMDSNPAEGNLHSVEALITGFLNRPPNPVPLTWFDREMRPVLSFDVFARPFPKEKGYARYTLGPFDLLILKLEVPDTEKERIIADFVGLERFDLTRWNTGAQEDYAETYRRFKQRLVLPRAHLDELLTSKYARHFYTDAEIARVYERWGEEEPSAT
jgi:hypothetical protein